MSSNTETTEINDDEVRLAIQGMIGNDMYVIVRKTAFFTDVRAHVAEMLRLTYREVHLMVNYKEPDEISTIQSLLPLLEERKVVDLLIVSEDE